MSISTIQKTISEAESYDLWEEPDMAVISQTEVPPKFPLEFLDAQWQKWVSEMAEAKGCPPDFIVGSLLTGTSGFIGNARRASPWEGWDEPTILWCALVGLPSSGKSPAMDAVLNPIRSIENELSKVYKANLPEYETSKLQAQLKYESWFAEVKKTIQDRSDPLVRPIETYEPEKPVRPRIIMVDTTIEEAGQLLSRNPKGLILAKDELSGLLENFTRRGGSDKAFYLESFGGRPYTVDRVKHSEPIIIPSLAISILGGIQPDRLDSLVLKEADDGFAARFLYIWPNKSTPSRPKCIPDNDFVMAFFNRLHTLPTGNTPCVLRLSEEAVVMFSEWREKDFREEEKVQGLLLSHVGKFPGLVIRLSIILTYLEWGLTPENAVEPVSISKIHVSKAIALMDGYFLPMARRCFLDSSLPQNLRDAKCLAKWILQEQPREFNASRLTRMKGSPLRDSKRLDDALRVLVEAGWIRSVGTRQGDNYGRMKKDFKVNPKALLKS
jgi:hypothetical protein